MKRRVCVSASLLLLLHAGNSTLFPRWQMVLPLPLSGVCAGRRNSRRSVGSCSAKTAEEKYFPSENDCRRQHLSQLTEFYYSELVLTPELKKFQRHVLSNVDSMKQISVASFSSKINPFCKCCQCYMSLLCPPFRLKHCNNWISLKTKLLYSYQPPSSSFIV